MLYPKDRFIFYPRPQIMAESTRISTAPWWCKTGRSESQPVLKGRGSSTWG